MRIIARMCGSDSGKFADWRRFGAIERSERNRAREVMVNRFAVCDLWSGYEVFPFAKGTEIRLHLYTIV